MNVTREELDELYNKRRWTLSKIATHLSVSTLTVRRWMDQFGLPRRTQSEAQRPPVNEDNLRQTLDELYNEQRWSLPKIARQLDVSLGTVYNWMERMGIPRRDRTEAAVEASRKPLDEDKIERLYAAGLTLDEIAKRFDVHGDAIGRRLKARGVPLRHRHDYEPYPRKDFSGDPLEKAYLLGFRQGDLHVRPTSISVEVSTSTTKTEQINLFQGLFSQYSRVRVVPFQDKHCSNHSLACCLNMSFDFLIPKHDSVPAWILRPIQAGDLQPFIAFLAGYTDAEGSFFVRGAGDSGFTLASYDVNVLRQIQSVFNDYLDISCPPVRLGALRGRSIANQYSSNKDLWHLGVYRKASLDRICELLEPHLKHAKRRKDMHAVWANVKARGIKQ